MSTYVITREGFPHSVHLLGGARLTEAFPSTFLCVHAQDCPDVRESGIEVLRWDAQGSTLHDMVDAIYGPAGGSFYEDVYEPGTPEHDNAWRSYVAEFLVMECAGHLEEG